MKSRVNLKYFVSYCKSTSCFGPVLRTINYFHTVSTKVIKNPALSDQLEEEYLEY